MKRKILTALGLMALPMSMMAQLMPLLPEGSKNQLWLDPDRVYNYNLYEKSRWGVGLQYDITLNKKKYKYLALSAYGAYGYADQRFKWGLKADYQKRTALPSHTYVGFVHDLTPAASRAFTRQSQAILSAPASVMTSLFNDAYRLTFGHSRQVSKTLVETLELSLSRERQLYWPIGNPGQWPLLYPPSYSDLKDLPYRDFVEAHLQLSHSSGLQGELTAGVVDQWDKAFLRMLMLFDRHVPIGPFDLHLFAQSGATWGDLPYSRMFDLGGSWGCPISLNHTLLTARPNEFTSNIFGMINLRFTTTNPLFDFFSKAWGIGTSPHPYVLCNGAWGATWDNVPYPAPDRGIAEVGAGIDGLVVWGAVYWGVGVAYRLTPSSAPYHLTETHDNLTLLFTAYLDL